MMRKLRKLLLKVFSIIFIIWGIYFIFDISDSLKDYLNKRNEDLTNPQFIFFHKPTPFHSRNDELQKSFKQGQDLLKSLRHTSLANLPPTTHFYSKNDFINKAIPSDIEASSLTDKTKELIYSGLIVPRWNLLKDEIPLDASMPG